MDLPDDRKSTEWPVCHQMKSRTEYVRAEFATIIRKETAEYKKYRSLTDRWVQLAIELSKLKILQLKDS